MFYALFVAYIWAMACLYFDSYWTAKGCAAGVAVEGNVLIKLFARTNKPKFWQCYSIDGALRSIFLGIGFIPASEEYPRAFTAMMIGALIACGFKNIQGARKWQWMYKNPGKLLPIPKSAWAQFLGFWG